MYIHIKFYFKLLDFISTMDKRKYFILRHGCIFMIHRIISGALVMFCNILNTLMLYLMGR